MKTQLKFVSSVIPIKGRFMNIALITYDISPFRGSEASVSWNFVTQMSRHVRLTVIYGSQDNEIEHYIQTHHIDNVEWIAVPKKDVGRFGRGLRQDYYFSLYYRQWHREAADIVRRLADSGSIDLIHYLNPIGFKEPGWCWENKNVPYVWGPVQGVDNRPLKLCKALGIKGTVFAVVRRIVHNGLFMYYPRVRKAFRRADAIFAATPATVRGLKRHHHRDALYLPENGITAMETDTPVTFAPNDTFRMIWIGGLDVDRKAIGIVLDALLQLKHTNWHIDIFGDGTPSTINARKISDLGSRITLHGKVDREIVQRHMRESHLHIISSLGEATTTVLFEAMAKAVPTMTLDHCGMAGVVCHRCGIKIPIATYGNVTSRMAREIDRLIDSPDRVAELSRGVLECSKRFMWANRIDTFLDTYQRLTAQYATR